MKQKEFESDVGINSVNGLWLVGGGACLNKELSAAELNHSDADEERSGVSKSSD